MLGIVAIIKIYKKSTIFKPLFIFLSIFSDYKMHTSYIKAMTMINVCRYNICKNTVHSTETLTSSARMHVCWREIALDALQICRRV